MYEVRREFTLQLEELKMQLAECKEEKEFLEDKLHKTEREFDKFRLQSNTKPPE